MPVGFATVFATRISRQSAGGPQIPISGPRRLRSLTRLARPHAQNPNLTPVATDPYPQNPQNPVLRVLRVPIHDPFLDQPPQWGFS